MTGPASGGTAARMRATSQHLHEKAVRHGKALEWAGEQTAAVRGTAASDDGTVRATVDQTGMLTDLEVAPDALRKLSSTELTGLITSLVRHATADARNQVRDTYQGLVDEGTIHQVPSHVLPAPALEPDGSPRAETTVNPTGDEGPPRSWLDDDY